MKKQELEKVSDFTLGEENLELATAEAYNKLKIQ